MTQNTRLQQQLERNELVLRALREACRDTPLFRDSRVSFVRATTCTMDQLYLNGEGKWDWQEFHHNYFKEVENRKAGCAPVDSFANCYVSAPQWMRWNTGNRLAYAEYRPKILEALRGLPVSISEDSGWTWLRNGDSQRPESKPQYKKEFGFLLSFNDRLQGNTEAAVARLSTVCQSNDARADRDIFELLEDTGYRVGDGSYSWTAAGFRLRVWAKNEAEKLRTVFADCVTELLKEDTSQGVAWTLAVDFPV